MKQCSRVIPVLLMAFFFSGYSLFAKDTNASFSSLAMKYDYVNRMGDVIEEIALVNLLRGLYLTKDQTLRIHELVKQAQRERELGLTRLEQLNSLPVLENLRDQLFSALAEDPPADRAHAVDLDNQGHDIIGQSLHKIAKLEDEVCKILTKGQLEIFWDFAPCIVPEVDFENPVRTGQAGGSSRMYGVVEQIRNATEDQWKTHGTPFLRYLLQLFEQELGEMTDDVRDDLFRRLTRIAWKIRQMDEGEYLLHRSALAAEMMVINREKTTRSGFRTTGKVARFFLSPAAVSVFPRWLETHFQDEREGSGGLPCHEALGASQGIELPQGSTKQGTSRDTKSDTSNDGRNGKNEPAPIPQKSSHLPEAEGVIDDEFWRAVPEACRYVAETPYWDHARTAFPSPYSYLLFSEEHKDVGFDQLLENALVILQGKGKMTYYSIVPGEP